MTELERLLAASLKRLDEEHAVIRLAVERVRRRS